uniref:Uncharacterized protein n=1 Tax=Arundo donax TaxID=35708 RepID=A0A0A9DFZ5_ARUDO
MHQIDVLPHTKVKQRIDLGDNKRIEEINLGGRRCRIDEDLESRRSIQEENNTSKRSNLLLLSCCVSQSQTCDGCLDQSSSRY